MNCIWLKCKTILLFKNVWDQNGMLTPRLAAWSLSFIDKSIKIIYESTNHRVYWYNNSLQLFLLSKINLCIFSSSFISERVWNENEIFSFYSNLKIQPFICSPQSVSSFVQYDKRTIRSQAFYSRNIQNAYSPW